MFVKRSNQNREGVNYLASIADLMAGLLFVTLIGLAFFATELQKQKEIINNDKRLTNYSQLEKEKQEKERLFLLEKEKNDELSRVLNEVKEELLSKQKLYEETKEALDKERKKVQQLAVLTKDHESLLALQEKLEKEENEIRHLENTIERLRNIFENSDRSRANLLTEIQNYLRSNYGINVEIDNSTGVVRLPEDEINFQTGRAELSPSMKKRLITIREVLDRFIPCFVGKKDAFCQRLNPDGHSLDAVFVEGHTDNQPFGTDPTGKLNRRLSTERANTVYEILMQPPSNLSGLFNPKGQKLFSLSGYGEERPVPGHEHKEPTDDKINRRIELRFSMSAPKINMQKADSENIFNFSDK